MKGTVFFRPSKSAKTEGKAKKQGTWTYAFSVPRAGGTRRQITKGGFATKRACETALAGALAAHGQGSPVAVEPSKMTVERFLLDEWLPIKKRALKPSTYAWNRMAIPNYVAPNIGDVRLCDLSASQLSAMYTKLRESGSVRKGKGGVQLRGPLAERTVHKVHVLMTSALGHALITGRIRVNPVSMIPKDERPKQNAVRPEMKVWSAEEARAFLEATAGDRHAPIYDLALNTGLRRGELAGLRWDAVDLDAAVLRIYRNRVSVDYEVHEGTPKSDKARVVDVDPGTVAMLRRWRKVQLEERLAAGEVWQETGHVFTREDGVPLHPDTIGSNFKRLLSQAGARSIRLHDLRHTHATLGLAAGVPVKVMSERLGHATVQITIDLYQHVIPGMGADAAAKIGGLLRRAQ